MTLIFKILYTTSRIRTSPVAHGQEDPKNGVPGALSEKVIVKVCHANTQMLLY
jgi:hypothetical protein